VSERFFFSGVLSQLSYCGAAEWLKLIRILKRHALSERSMTRTHGASDYGGRRALRTLMRSNELFAKEKKLEK